jgi:propionate CoA-transferase
VIFSGTFTAGEVEITWPGGQTLITREGKFNKFISTLEQVSYHGPFARERNQEAYYITERAVFRRGEKGIELIEIAPGIDLDRDILAHMDFKPQIAHDLKSMDARLFCEQKMGLLDDLLGKEPCNVPPRLRKKG